MAASPDSLTPMSYAQWVRRTIRRNRNSRNLLVSLFESSVPEPTDLLREVILEAFGDGITSRYTSTFADGNPYLVSALAKDYGVEAEQVLTTTGATGALSLIYRALLAPGDRILVENPGFDLFANLAHASGNAVDRFERRGPDYAVDPDEINAAISDRTRLVVLSNLHNPSGMPLDLTCLPELAAIAERRNVLFVFDEVYGPYAEDTFRPAASLGLSDRFLSVSSLTKSYGLSTLRCGWMVGDSTYVNKVRSLAREVEFAISNLTHGIAALVVESPERFRRNAFSVLERAHPVIQSYHNHWRRVGLVEGVLPQHGCITFPRLAGIEDTLAFSGWLSDRCGVVIAPGEYFGAPGHVRLGFGMEPSQLDYGLQALTDGLITYRETDRSTIA